jgi:hypothetical protein
LEPAGYKHVKIVAIQSGAQSATGVPHGKPQIQQLKDDLGRRLRRREIQ